MVLIFVLFPSILFSCLYPLVLVGISPSAWFCSSFWSQQPKSHLSFSASVFVLLHNQHSGWCICGRLIVNLLCQAESLYLRAELRGDSSLQGKIAFPISTLNVPLPAAARRCCPLNIFHPIAYRQPEFPVRMSTTEILHKNGDTFHYEEGNAILWCLFFKTK